MSSSNNNNLMTDATSAAQNRGFECAVAGCGKVFRRKEHLTRHQKSHETLPQYVCHICGRRYARSDVLKRHVEFHPQYYKSRRSFVACIRCRESKTRCDEENPCKPCSRRSLPCIRGAGNDSSGGLVDDDEQQSRASGSNAAAVQEESATAFAADDAPSPSPSTDHLLMPGNDSSSQRPTQLGHLLIDRYSDVFERRLVVYNAVVHPLWPVLLAPEPVGTMAYGDVPDVVITSIAMLASWVEGDQDHLNLFPLVLDELCGIQLWSPLPLPILQAMALCLVYMVSNLATEGMVPKALKVHNDLVTACRLSGLFYSQGGMWYSCSSSNGSSEPTSEEDKELRYRLAFAVLRLDAYLSMLTDFPPLLRSQELSMPLGHTASWASGIGSEAERRELVASQGPPMRKRTPFSFLVHDLLGAPRPGGPSALAPAWTRMDYHFVLCAVQTGAWEGAHQALRTVPDDLHSRTLPRDLRRIWYENLQVWKRGLGTDCGLPESYLKSPSLGCDPVTPHTLLLYHLASIKVHSPSYLWCLRRRYYKPFPSSPSPHSSSLQDPSTRSELERLLRDWQGVRSARLAVWHAAQISRIVTRELAHSHPHLHFSSHPHHPHHPPKNTPALNPLLIPSLLTSAIIMLAYTYRHAICPRCRPAPSDVPLLDIVNVLDASEDSPRMRRYLDHDHGGGDVILDWGGNFFTVFPVCRCSRTLLADWFRKLLPARAETVLLGFLGELDVDADAW
ncbi:hypothetical protein F5Y17DRAFT_341929 [Xylariaceae sp. FL0594]|nr:hypothetical protein F5Y17DRAFT_341929 [Xylariaceae sp. FL0594]